MVSLPLIGCKRHDEGVQNCSVVMQGMDQCVEHRGKQASCLVAVDNIKQLLQQTTVNDYNRSMWADDCRRICLGTIEYRSVVRRNYEDICINSEVFNIKDDRFIKLAALSGIFLTGFIVLLFGIRSFLRASHFRRDAIKTRGIVVGHEASSSDGSAVYAPVIEFKDWMGKEFRFTSTVARSHMGKPAEEIDSEVKLLYPKDRPEEARRDSFMVLWLLPFFLLVWGGGFALMSGYGLFAAREWRQHHGYLQQHAPTIAKSMNSVAMTVRELMPTLTGIRDYRITEEKPDSIIIEADYRLSPFKSGDIYMGAITMTNGKSGGDWGYRPAHLQSGSGTARVKLSMGSESSDYCSNQIQLSIYYSGKGSFYERVIPYEKCWARQE